MAGETDPTSMNLILVLLQNCSCTLQSVLSSCQHSSNTEDSSVQVPYMYCPQASDSLSEGQQEGDFQKLAVSHVQAIQQALWHNLNLKCSVGRACQYLTAQERAHLQCGLGSSVPFHPTNSTDQPGCVRQQPVQPI